MSNENPFLSLGASASEPAPTPQPPKPTENPFLALANTQPTAPSDNPFLTIGQPPVSTPAQFASSRKADFGTNLATGILAASQVPTTLMNQHTLGEPLDPMRETSGADVIKKLQEKPVLDRFQAPDITELATNPFISLAKTAYENLPAALSVVTPEVSPQTQRDLTTAGAEAGKNLPLIPDAIGEAAGTIAGKLLGHPEIITGIASDVVRDPLNAVAPISKATGAGKALSNVAKESTFKLGQMLPEGVVQALKSRFIPAINRVEKGVKTAYQEALGTKNLREADILKEAEQHKERLAPIYQRAGENAEPAVLDLLENKRYKFPAVLTVAKNEDEAAKLHSFVLNFKANRQAEREALEKAGVHIKGLEGIDYATHVMTDKAKEILGEKGARNMGMDKAFNLSDPSLYKRLFKHPDGSDMTINEVNRLFAEGKMPGFGETKIEKFFETDPVLIDAVAKSRTSKILAEKSFYDELAKYAKNDGVEVSAKLLGKDLLEGLKFDPEVKELVDNAKNYVFSDEITNLYDKATNYWKGLVTATPQFHARNAFNNVVSNAAAGLVNPKYYGIAADIQKGKPGVLRTLANGQQITFKDVANIATKYGLDKGFLSTDSPKALKEALYPAKDALSMSRAAGSKIEANAKLAHLAFKLDEGATIEEAVNSVKKTLFDYSELTPFERQKMKRLFPFYSWMRKNIPRQLEIALTAPQVNSKQSMIRSNIESAEPLTERQQKAKPDYFNELLAIHLGKSPSGRNIFFGVGLPSLDLTRFKRDPEKNLSENIFNTAGQFVSDVNPFMKMGIEGVFNRSTQDVSRNLTVDKGGKWVPVPEYVGLLPDSVQRLVGVSRNPKTKQLLMSKPWAIVMNNLVSVPQLRIAGKAGSEKLTPEEKAFAVMSFFTGIKWIPEDLKRDAVREHRRLIQQRRNQRSDRKRFRDVGEE